MSAPTKKHPGDSRGRIPPTHTEVAAADDRNLYRVRDKDWVKVWGENLSRVDANALCTKVTSERKSRSARVESMDIDPPEGIDLNAVRVEGAPNGSGHHAHAHAAPTISVVVVPEAPYVKIWDEKRAGKVYTYGLRRADNVRVVLKVADVTTKPVAPAVRDGLQSPQQPRDPQLAAMQSDAFAAAGQSARQAQARADAMIERDKTIAKAAELEKMLEGDDPIDEGALQDLIGEVGVEPTDDDIAEHLNGAGDTDAPVS